MQIIRSSIRPVDMASQQVVAVPTCHTMRVISRLCIERCSTACYALWAACRLKNAGVLGELTQNRP